MKTQSMVIKRLQLVGKDHWQRKISLGREEESTDIGPIGMELMMWISNISKVYL
jgi:hypothetical protein